MRLKPISTYAFTVVTFLMTGCGAGGRDYASEDPSALAVSTATFNLSSAWTNLVKNGYTKTMRFGGNSSVCTGSMLVLQSPAQTTAYAGYPYTSQASFSETYTNCSDGVTRSHNNYTITNYYYNNYTNNYFATANQKAYWESPAAFPSEVKVGDTGLIGTVNIYDSNNVFLAKEFWRYYIDQRTATTVIFTLNISDYVFDANMKSSWSATENYYYILDTENTLTLRSYDRSYASGLTLYAE